MESTLPSPSRSARHHRHWNWWVILAALGWLGFSALTLLLPSIENPQLAQVALSASVILSMLLLLAILMAAERPRWPLPVRIGMFVGGALMVLTPYWAQLNLALIKSLVALGLMAVAVPVGYWIGERMEKITNLIPLAIAMSLADIFSLFIQGPTKAIKDDLVVYHETKQAQQAITEATGQAPAVTLKAPLADFIIVHFPIAGQEMTSPVLGIGDFVVLAFLFRAAWVHHINPRLVFASAAGSILAAIACAMWLDMALPALPFIGLGTISVLWLSQPRMRRMDRQEVVLSIAVALLFAALIVGKWLSRLLQGAGG